MYKFYFILMASLLVSSCGSTKHYDKRFYYKKSDDVSSLVALLVKKEDMKKHRQYAKKHKLVTTHDLKKITKDIDLSKKGITDTAIQYIGSRYKWGGTKPSGFDCSGYTKYVYQKSGVDIPRNPKAQAKFGKFIQKHQLKAGDLIFFDTSKNKNGKVSHVGIYLGKDKFLHASGSKRRIIIDSLKKPFFQDRFKWARRVVIN